MGANSFLLEYNPSQNGFSMHKSKQEVVIDVFFVEIGEPSTKSTQSSHVYK